MQQSPLFPGYVTGSDWLRDSEAFSKGARSLGSSESRMKLRAFRGLRSMQSYLQCLYSPCQYNCNQWAPVRESLNTQSCVGQGVPQALDTRPLIHCGLYWDHGDENGSYCSMLGLYSYWDYGKEIEATVVYWGLDRDYGKETEATVVYWGVYRDCGEEMYTTIR